MVTIQQLCRSDTSKKGGRVRKTKRTSSALGGAPMLKGVCLSVETTTPRKPNSAIRAIAKLKLSNGRFITAYIPGFKPHGLQQHSYVNVIHKGPPDLAGIRHRVVRGRLDALPHANRKNARSKYGVSKPS